MVYQWDINAFQIKEKLFIKNIKQQEMFVKIQYGDLIIFRRENKHYLCT